MIPTRFQSTSSPSRSISGLWLGIGAVLVLVGGVLAVGVASMGTPPAQTTTTVPLSINY